MKSITLERRFFATDGEWEYLLHQLEITDDPRSIYDIEIRDILTDDIIITYNDETT